MDGILVAIATTLLSLSIRWFIIECKRSFRKNPDIIEEHFKKQRELKFNKRCKAEKKINKIMIAYATNSAKILLLLITLSNKTKAFHLPIIFTR